MEKKFCNSTNINFKFSDKHRNHPTNFFQGGPWPPLAPRPRRHWSERYQANAKDKNKSYISVETPFDNSRIQVFIFPAYSYSISLMPVFVRKARICQARICQVTLLTPLVFEGNVVHILVSLYTCANYLICVAFAQ